MARLATLVATRLKTVSAITALTGARVLDLDYRSAGWQTAPVPVLTELGVIQPTLVVDDQGSTTPVFSRMRMAEETTIAVWAFAPNTAQGADQVDTLIQAVRRSLDGWQEPATRVLLTRTLRLGQVPAEDGITDRIDFRAAGVPI